MKRSLEALAAAEDPLVAYGAAAELGLPEASRHRERLLADRRVIALVEELQAWPGPAIASHKSASQFFHKLVFLAEAGLRAGDPGVKGITDRIIDSLDEEGVPTLAMEISPAHGGTGDRVAAWALCDAPSTLYALKLLGVKNRRVEAGAESLAALVRPDGFPCACAKSLGGWRGPGKKEDPCPYATLVMLRLLLLSGERHRRAVDAAAACLLALWEGSRERHPYIFHMGDDFRKLKLPFIWYDILHVLEVLSRVAPVREDRRFREMLSLVQAKEGVDGFVPESVYQPWKAWDFGQKKQVSDWMTLCVRRIEARLS